MDLKGIIAQHADPVARKHGTTWSEVLEECRTHKHGKPWRPETTRAMSQIYRMTVLTGPEVLKGLYDLKHMPTWADIERMKIKESAPQ